MDNATTDSSRNRPAEYVTVVYCCVLGIVSPTIVVGNLLTIAAFARRKFALKHTHILLMNLAAADILVGAVSIPMFIYVVGSSNGWWKKQPHIVNLVYDANDILSGFASIFSLTCIALERLYAIGWPLYHRLRTRRAYYMCICFIWLMSGFIVTLRFLVQFNTLKYIIVISFALSLLLTFAAYGKLWHIVKTRKVTQSQLAAKRDRKLAKTLALVTIVFVFSWVPFQVIIAVFYYFCAQSCPTLPHVIFYITKILHYANSLANPIVYVFRMTAFRKSVKEMFQWKTTSEQHGGVVLGYNNRALNLCEDHISASRDDSVMDTKL